MVFTSFQYKNDLSYLQKKYVLNKKKANHEAHVYVTLASSSYNIPRPTLFPINFTLGAKRFSRPQLFNQLYYVLKKNEWSQSVLL